MHNQCNIHGLNYVFLNYKYCILYIFFPMYYLFLFRHSTLCGYLFIYFHICLRKN
uniref:Uncharacterized protein n=1 Tax=Anguilla anguilla TaxID=7936 RepID=A0A0E9WUZ7_ANGAN